MVSDRHPQSVMPCDFDEAHAEGDYGRPVELREGIGDFAPLEIIWSAELPGAALPLRRGKK